ncbi:MerR family transcriptional regulator [Nocardioides sp. CPCC 205120]|uniref:MerR family transcriptional regulator n=1 Tax=Nocardioides sp. CPCC 205120 TaxID=3406462 RepID=UPI003B507B39
MGEGRRARQPHRPRRRRRRGVDALRPVELVTISEAARRIGIPRTTVRNWATRDGLLNPRGLDRDGMRLYDLALIRDVAAARRCAERPRTG